jgi:uncharacterized protein
MLDVIEKLLVLQDRDRQILRLKDELARIPPERHELNAKFAAITSKLEAGKLQQNHLESERKKLELDVEAKKQLIERYSLQQFQTKKNEEYRALAHEIEMCKETINQIENQEIELMEQAETNQKEVAAANRSAAETKRVADGRLAELAAREQSLLKELGGLEVGRNELASAVEEGIRTRYERLFKNRGTNVVVGIQHGVCGGCHVQLNRQVVVHCRGDQEIINCPNCGRILYYTPDMDVAVVE